VSVQEAEVVGRRSVIRRQMVDVDGSVAVVLVRDPKSIDDDPLVLLSAD
jgi:hypothetical protein